MCFMAGPLASGSTLGPEYERRALQRSVAIKAWWTLSSHLVTRVWAEICIGMHMCGTMQWCNSRCQPCPDHSTEMSGQLSMHKPWTAVSMVEHRVIVCCSVFACVGALFWGGGGWGRLLVR